MIIPSMRALKLDYMIIYTLLRATLPLLLPRCFSHVRFCETPQVAAHQALPSLVFSRQEHCSGLPFPSPSQSNDLHIISTMCMRAKSLQLWVCAKSLPTLWDSMNFSPLGSCVHGILQVRLIEWVAMPSPGITHISLTSPALTGMSFTTSAAQEALSTRQVFIKQISSQCMADLNSNNGFYWIVILVTHISSIF